LIRRTAILVEPLNGIDGTADLDVAFLLTEPQRARDSAARGALTYRFST